MITGSSAINNIHTATVTEPHIRATLKQNSFIGKGWSGAVRNEYYKDMRSVLFNNNYVLYSNMTKATVNHILTYNSGGSLLSSYGISINTWAGLSWADGGFAYVSKGDFVVSGNTINLYFLRHGSTFMEILFVTEVCRVSSSNGTSWSGVTVVNRPIAQNTYKFDISMVGETEFYLMGIEASTTHGFNRSSMYYGLHGSSAPLIYNELEKTTLEFAGQCKVMNFADRRYIIKENGQDTPILDDPTTVSRDVYSFPTINLLSVGNTNVFNVKKIAYTGSSIYGLHLIHGGVGNSYAYFGIDRYIREIDPYITTEGYKLEYITDVDTTHTLCKMDSMGRIYQRVIGVGGTFLASICIGGISSSQTPDLTLIVNDGASRLLFYPFFESIGSSTDISGNIISYSLRTPCLENQQYMLVKYL